MDLCTCKAAEQELDVSSKLQMLLPIPTKLFPERRTFAFESRLTEISCRVEPACLPRAMSFGRFLKPEGLLLLEVLEHSHNFGTIGIKMFAVKGMDRKNSLE